MTADNPKIGPSQQATDCTDSDRLREKFDCEVTPRESSFTVTVYDKHTQNRIASFYGKTEAEAYSQAATLLLNTPLSTPTLTRSLTEDDRRRLLEGIHRIYPCCTPCQSFREGWSLQLQHKNTYPGLHVTIIGLSYDEVLTAGAQLAGIEYLYDAGAVARFRELLDENTQLQQRVDQYLKRQYP